MKDNLRDLLLFVAMANALLAGFSAGELIPGRPPPGPPTHEGPVFLALFCFAGGAAFSFVAVLGLGNLELDRYFRTRARIDGSSDERQTEPDPPYTREFLRLWFVILAILAAALSGIFIAVRVTAPYPAPLVGLWVGAALGCATVLALGQVVLRSQFPRREPIKETLPDE